VAERSENATLPKSVSGGVLHIFVVTQTDGASAIHSAEDESIRDTRRVRVNILPVLRLRIRNVTSRSFTVTDATIASPACTFSLSVIGAAGTSS